MNISRCFVLSGAVLLMAAATLRAGADGPPMPVVRAAGPSPVAQMDDYLHGQHVAHAIETAGGDFKGDGAETLTVRIYGVTDESRQSALCAALGAAAKKSRVRAVGVLFYTSGPEGGVSRAVFQPSQLPGGNGSVEFVHDALAPMNYRLLRTVKL